MCTTYYLSSKSTEAIPFIGFCWCQGRKMKIHCEAWWHLVKKEKSLHDMSQYPLIHIQTLSFIKGRMMTHYIELARKDKFLSDHINRIESSTICTFLSFQPHWRHPLPLKGRSLLTQQLPPSSHFSCLEPIGVLPCFSAPPFLLLFREEESCCWSSSSSATWSFLIGSSLWVVG